MLTKTQIESYLQNIQSKVLKLKIEIKEIEKKMQIGSVREIEKKQRQIDLFSAKINTIKFILMNP